MSALFSHFRRCRWFYLSVLFFGVAEMIVFCFAIIKSKEILTSADAVVVFGGKSDRPIRGLEIAVDMRCPYLIVSDNEFEIKRLKPKLKKAWNLKIETDLSATTTDANARNTAVIIKKLGIKSVVLVTSWYHIPRSAILLRLYLLGSGVKVYPVAAEPPPPHFYLKGIFWLEMLKLWGSLGRAAIHSI